METGETCLYNKSVTVQNISETKKSDYANLFAIG